MSIPTENETWIIEEGDIAIRRSADVGLEGVSPIERLIYCLWVADYGMRNAGDLETAADLYPEFKSEGARLSKELRLDYVAESFTLSDRVLEQEYLERFDGICVEIRGAQMHLAQGCKSFEA